MNQEEERLDAMLKAHKITAEDHNMLVKALNKKPSFLDKISTFMLINPFRKIAGAQALVLGLVVLIAMSYVGVFAKVYFPGVLSVLNASVVVPQKIEINFFLLAYQVLIAWLILSLLFFIAAKLCQQKRMRAIDFLGTVALARYPSLILTTLIGVIRQLNPDFLSMDVSHGISMQPAWGMSVFSGTVITLFIWQIGTYYFALKESSGLTGRKLWISFIVTLVLGELIVSPITTIFMN